MPDRPIVVIIEPEHEFARQLRVDFERHGIEATDTGDGMTGVDLCRQVRPNAIILCVELQRMSGYKICSMLKKDPALRDVPVIMTSRQKSDADFEPHRALKNPAQAYFNKEIPIAEITAAVCELIGHPVSAVSLPPPPPVSDQSTDVSDESQVASRPNATKDIDSSLVLEEVDETSSQELAVESELLPVEDQEQDLIPMGELESETFPADDDVPIEPLSSDEGLTITEDDSIPVDDHREGQDAVFDEDEADSTNELAHEAEIVTATNDETTINENTVSEDLSQSLELTQADEKQDPAVITPLKSESTPSEPTGESDGTSESEDALLENSDENGLSQQTIPTRDIAESAQVEVGRATEKDAPDQNDEQQVQEEQVQEQQVQEQQGDLPQGSGSGYDVEFSDIPSPELSNSEVVSFVDAALGELIDSDSQSVSTDELKLMTAEVEFLKSRVIELEQEKIHLKSTFEEYDGAKSGRISVSNRETLALKKERNDLRKELLSIKSLLAERDVEILKWSDRETELETELVDIADENEKLLTEKAYLENELASNKDALSQIQEEHDRAVHERERLISSEKTYESRIEELQLEAEDLRSQIPEEGTKARLLELENDLDMAKTNIDALKASVRIKDGELVAQRQFVEDKSVQNEQLQSGLERYRSMLDVAEQDRVELRDALDEAELQKETLSGELEEYERVVELAAEKRLKALTAMQIAQQLLHESTILTQEQDDYTEEYSQDLYSQDISQDLINEVQSEIGEALTADKAPEEKDAKLVDEDSEEAQRSDGSEELAIPEVDDSDD